MAWTTNPGDMFYNLLSEHNPKPTNIELTKCVISGTRKERSTIEKCIVNEHEKEKTCVAASNEADFEAICHLLEGLAERK